MLKFQHTNIHKPSWKMKIYKTPWMSSRSISTTYTLLISKIKKGKGSNSVTLHLFEKFVPMTLNKAAKSTESPTRVTRTNRRLKNYLNSRGLLF